MSYRSDTSIATAVVDARFDDVDVVHVEGRMRQGRLELLSVLEPFHTGRRRACHFATNRLSLTQDGSQLFGLWRYLRRCLKRINEGYIRCRRYNKK